jgi:hypothetical protein
MRLYRGEPKGARRQRRRPMQYMLLIYEDETIYGEGKDSPSLDEIVRRHQEFAEGLAAEGVIRGGNGLKDTSSATTVRTLGGAQTVHDGPFAETREQLGGYYLIDVPDLDAAMIVARRLPLARDGSVEIRPVLETG